MGLSSLAQSFDPVANTSRSMSKGNRLEQCLVDIDLGLNHGICEWSTKNERSRVCSTEGAPRPVRVGSCNCGLRSPDARSITRTEKILTCQLRQTATFNQHGLGTTLQ